MSLLLLFGQSEAGVTGTFAATESGADAFTASGTVLVQGALAAAESGADIFSAQSTAPRVVAAFTITAAGGIQVR